MDISKITAAQFYSKFGVDDNTVDYTGHALALYLNDECVASSHLHFVPHQRWPCNGISLNPRWGV